MTPETPKLESYSYEPFDPEVELKNIRKYDKETRTEKLEEYKKELIKQKEGIAEIQDDLEKHIRENPDLNQEELMKIVSAKAPEYRLSNNQLNLFDETLNKYIAGHQAVREARKQYGDDRELFKACFGKKPEGVVEVIEGPVTLYFRCENLSDYAWIYKAKFLAPKPEQNITMKDMTSANRTLGFFLTADCLIPQLKYAITVEKALLQGTSHPKSEEILKHEEQHSIYKLYKEQYLRNSIERILIEPEIREKIAQELKNKQFPKILIDYLRTWRENFDNYAKDEVLAFYKSGVPLSKTIDWFFRPQGPFDYFYQNKKLLYKTLQDKLGSDIVKKEKKTIEKILNKVFVDEYHQEIFDNAYAIRELENMGKSKEDIVHLLITEPLSRWDKLVKRLKKYGSSS